jgi:hypothetical protein
MQVMIPHWYANRVRIFLAVAAAKEILAINGGSQTT